ncbi:hypothetical protein GCM10012280_69710 [Wenjunlia tyrosinilytica]|uniref:Uncharacterized protein n=1 Tax=Wenjunlia tyrosinilytica TaxID=1544741 RepID=A0A918A156_9ACTN|nr:hypothetical protein GCM10012280_69710 [Wenjunlia tyrosinilytica]
MGAIFESPGSKASEAAPIRWNSPRAEGAEGCLGSHFGGRTLCIHVTCAIVLAIAQTADDLRGALRYELSCTRSYETWPTPAGDRLVPAESPSALRRVVITPSGGELASSSCR